MNIFSKPQPRLTVDVIIPNLEGKVLLLSRGHRPFKRFWCLPGGMVEYGETIERAAIREVQEEVGLQIMIDRLIGVFSRPERDPRGHYVSVAVAAYPVDAKPQISPEALAFLNVGAESHIEMAFDHVSILAAYWRSLQAPAKGVVA